MIECAEAINRISNQNRNFKESLVLMPTPMSTDEMEKLEKRLNEFFTKYADSKYDLWHGGTSKARRVTTGE